MAYNPIIHGRRSIRLSDFDYSQNGWYFITICTHNRRCLFGKIINRKMILNKFGEIAKNEWLNTKKIRKNVKIDKFRVMPNHIHGIIVINNNDRDISNSHVPGRGVLQYAPTTDQINKPNPLRNEPIMDEIDCNFDFTDKQTKFKSPAQTVGSIVRGYKSTTAKQINAIVKTFGRPVWQRNFYEHIILDEEDYWRIVNYIETNPENWESDRNYKSES